MAIEDDRIERLRTMIEIAERKGEADDPRTDRLKAELAEALRGEYPRDDADDDDDQIIRPECARQIPTDETNEVRAERPVFTGLPFADRIKRRLQDYGAFEIGQLSAWNARLLRLALGPRDAQLVREAMARLGMSDLLASDREQLSELPPKTPFAIDVRDGRTVQDIQKIARGLARRELTQRTASTEAGGKEHAGWHQRICSLFDRGSEIFAPEFESAMRDDNKTAPWFVDVSIARVPNARRRVWGLKLTTRWSTERTDADLDRRDREKYGSGCMATLNAGKGRGDAKRSWRGISLLMATTGERA